MLNGQAKDLQYATTLEINDVIRALPDWEKALIRFGYCGVQRGFRRIAKPNSQQRLGDVAND